MRIPQRARKGMTYANVTATLALVIALGSGTAYAAHLIGAGEIKKNAVHSRHVKAGAIKRSDLARSKTQGFEAVHAVRAADADRLSGLPSNAFDAGEGQAPTSTYRFTSKDLVGTGSFFPTGAPSIPWARSRAGALLGGNFEVRFKDRTDSHAIYSLLDRGGSNPDVSERVADGDTSAASAMSDDDRFEYFLAYADRVTNGADRIPSHTSRSPCTRITGRRRAARCG